MIQLDRRRGRPFPRVVLVSDNLLSDFILMQLPGCNCRSHCVHLAYNVPTSVTVVASTTMPTITFFSNCRSRLSTFQPTNACRPPSHPSSHPNCLRLHHVDANSTTNL
ncbi:Collagen alpha-1(XX) chain [Echinococcus multilocularis]|uniref:Collagen alpha-1(XX) chain n=1 Tax=Echinococcus multilocularis TaxID=6211 RepID=A0A0S4MQ53_ECHMU|nr:Collagen alpha-1(XX) chain [Echinococcus multilocularis]